ncbi:hypothetical protein, partial [Prevotellamassilia timonensis]|uniref:hypothetical protein n=1 Tax=Prevotellamassilia timonensis TaxID=1852370 RepID=UPI00307A1572
KHVAQAKKSVQSVRSVSDSNILLSGKTPKHKQPVTDNASTKRKHKTQPQNATSNGGDASRVGEKESNKQLLNRA